jgi:hypothetical protein
MDRETSVTHVRKGGEGRVPIMLRAEANQVATIWKPQGRHGRGGFWLSRPLRNTRASQERELPGVKGENDTR